MVLFSGEALRRWQSPSPCRGSPRPPTPSTASLAADQRRHHATHCRHHATHCCHPAVLSLCQLPPPPRRNLSPSRPRHIYAQPPSPHAASCVASITPNVASLADAPAASTILWSHRRCHRLSRSCFLIATVKVD
ncbi:hypothetical protein VPH35_020723 [Triticum aestivum]